MLRSIATVTAAGVTALAAMTASIASAAPDPNTAPAPGTSVVNDPLGVPQVRPDTLVLAAADANDQVTGIGWLLWEEDSAVGFGQQRTNNCLPDCASGTFQERPVVVVLDHAIPLADRPSKVFTQVTIRTIDDTRSQKIG